MTYAETLFLDVWPGKVPQVIAALSGISGYGLWVSDVGHLARIVMLRAVRSIDEMVATRTDLLAALPHDLLQSVEVTSWRVLSPFLESGRHGPVYEWRSYQAKPGQMAAVEALFLDALAPRLLQSSLLCALVSLDGKERIAHLWPYTDMKNRSEVRAAALASGQWPPKLAPMLSQMENDIMLPFGRSQWT